MYCRIPEMLTHWWRQAMISIERAELFLRDVVETVLKDYRDNVNNGELSEWEYVFGIYSAIDSTRELGNGTYPNSEERYVLVANALVIHNNLKVVFGMTAMDAVRFGNIFTSFLVLKVAMHNHMLDMVRKGDY